MREPAVKRRKGLHFVERRRPGVTLLWSGIHPAYDNMGRSLSWSNSDGGLEQRHVADNLNKPCQSSARIAFPFTQTLHRERPGSYEGSSSLEHLAGEQPPLEITTVSQAWGRELCQRRHAAHRVGPTSSLWRKKPPKAALRSQAAAKLLVPTSK